MVIAWWVFCFVACCVTVGVGALIGFDFLFVCGVLGCLLSALLFCLLFGCC